MLLGPTTQETAPPQREDPAQCLSEANPFLPFSASVILPIEWIITL